MSVGLNYKVSAPEIGEKAIGECSSVTAVFTKVISLGGVGSVSDKTHRISLAFSYTVHI
jgi:hypothetical protein